MNRDRDRFHRLQLRITPYGYGLPSSGFKVDLDNQPLTMTPCPLHIPGAFAHKSAHYRFHAPTGRAATPSTANPDGIDFIEMITSDVQDAYTSLESNYQE